MKTDVVADIRHLDFDLTCEDGRHESGTCGHAGPAVFLVTTPCDRGGMLCAGFTVYCLAAGAVNCRCGKVHLAAELTVLPIP